MWKKEDATLDTPRPAEAAPHRAEPPRATTPPSGRAIIGPSITIHGEVSGDEDLLIQGKVDGSVDLELHAVTVGSEGRVKANISARVVTVEGEVEGDLKAREQVVLRSAAQVKGDITAPRVVLEDGANFRGLVDMGEGDAPSRSAVPGASVRAPEGGKATPESPAKSPETGKASSRTPTASRPTP